MCLKAACGTLATAGRREWTRGQTAPGLIHLQILDDKCVPSQVRWFCSLRLRRMQAVLWRSGSDDRKGMFILVRSYKSHESVAKDLDTNFADYT